jgi:hypothetical protein
MVIVDRPSSFPNWQPQFFEVFGLQNAHQYNGSQGFALTDGSAAGFTFMDLDIDALVPEESGVRRAWR